MGLYGSAALLVARIARQHEPGQIATLPRTAAQKFREWRRLPDGVRARHPALTGRMLDRQMRGFRRHTVALFGDSGLCLRRS